MRRSILTLLTISSLLVPLGASAVKPYHTHPKGVLIKTGDVVIKTGNLEIRAGSLVGNLSLGGTGIFVHAGTGVFTLESTGLFSRTGTGGITFSNTGAFLRSGAAATTSFTHTGAWIRSGAAATTTFSETGLWLRSGVGLTEFSGGDISLTGSDTDLALTGAGSDLTVNGGGDLTVGGGGSIDVDTSGAGAYKIGGEVLHKCEVVTISTGEVLALAATPKVLVAAPGANKFIAVQSVTLAVDYATTVYDGVDAAEDFSIQYIGGSVKVTQDIESTGFIDQAGDELRFISAAPHALAAAAAADPLIPTVNAGIDITILVGEIATGDSPIDVEICYAIKPDLLD